jgi:flavin-dependent dehydrogenase
MRAEHDVVIVGGGPAGLASALHLCQLRPALRARLLVLEKAHYPRDKFCGGALARRAERALAQIGVEVDVPGVPFSRMSVRLVSGGVLTQPRRLGRVIRRIEFDRRLAEIARARGIHIAEGVTVAGLHVDAAGVTLATSQGEIRSRVVIGADGVGSVVRKALGAKQATWRAQVLELDTEPCATDRPRDVVHFDISDPEFSGYVWDFPTLVDGEPLVCRGVYHLLLPGQSAGKDEIEARLARHLTRLGLDPGAYRKKRFAERGFAPHEPIARPRVLLVGEAAGIDPVTGEGIAQALLYGKSVAPYLLERLDRDALHFRDWKRALPRSKLGVDLHIRHAMCRVIYGPARVFYDRWFSRNPAALELAARYFGGERVNRLELLRLLGSAAAYVLRSGEGRAALGRIAIPL